MAYVATIQIVLIPLDNIVSDPAIEAARYRPGDPCNVILTEEIQKATGLPWGYFDGSSWHKRTGLGPKNGYVHVTGIPDSIPFEKLKNKLLEADLKLENAGFANPEYTRRRVRRFRLPIDKISHPKVTTLIETQEVTVSFNAAKNFIKRKILSGDGLDQSLDDEGTSITDGDFA